MATTGQRSKSFALATRKELSKRHKDTSEVKQGLTGFGFKAIKPTYTSRPKIMKAEVQHQHLAADYDERDELNENDRALREYEICNKMPRGTATLEMLKKTPYGQEGWATMNPRVNFGRLYGKK